MLRPAHPMDNARRHTTGISPSDRQRLKSVSHTSSAIPGTSQPPLQRHYRYVRTERNNPSVHRPDLSVLRSPHMVLSAQRRSSRSHYQSKPRRQAKLTPTRLVFFGISNPTERTIQITPAFPSVVINLNIGVNTSFRILF